MTVQGVLHGGRTGAQIGALGGPWGAAAGAVAGAVIGGAIGWWAGNQIANQMSDADENAEEELEDKPVEECEGGCETTTPDNPDDLLDQGWEETSHPDAKAAGRRTFRNPKTGEELIFDKGKPGQPGWEGRDHYHRPNPNRTNRHDEYLDMNGDPTRRGSGPSHIPPGTTLGNGGAGS